VVVSAQAHHKIILVYPQQAEQEVQVSNQHATCQVERMAKVRLTWNFKQQHQWQSLALTYLLEEAE
jgi:hypothetical protein